MTKKDVREFLELINSDEELQKKVDVAMKAYTGNKTDEKAVFEGVIVPIAREAGYEFTYEDAKEFSETADEGELPEEELVSIAGGDAQCSMMGSLCVFAASKMPVRELKEETPLIR